MLQTWSSRKTRLSYSERGANPGLASARPASKDRQMKSPWDRYNKVIVAINDVDIAMIGETDEECLRLAEDAKASLRGLAEHYISLVKADKTV